MAGGPESSCLKFLDMEMIERVSLRHFSRQYREMVAWVPRVPVFGTRVLGLMLVALEFASVWRRNDLQTFRGWFRRTYALFP